jgi:hypothetical protein
MKSSALTIALIFAFSSFSLAENGTPVLRCTKKDFFYWNSDFVATVISYKNSKVLEFTYSKGTGRVLVEKHTNRLISGKSSFGITAQLTKKSGNLYSFVSRDSYDGLMSVGPVDVTCTP